MIRALGRLLECTRAAAAVEAAIVAPLFLILTLGITDLGTAMFESMAINAAAQAGAAYAVINTSSSNPSPTCLTNGVPALTANCLTGIKTAMNDASANSSFCNTPSVCSASIGTCADSSPTCIVVTATSTFSPILPDATYSWATSLTSTSTATIRIL
jgi:Flp pilus assembly protein TadG